MDNRRPEMNREERAMDSDKATASHLLWVVWVIVALLALSTGCGGSGVAPIAAPAGAQAGDLVGLAPCTYEASKVE